MDSSHWSIVCTKKLQLNNNREMGYSHSDNKNGESKKNNTGRRKKIVTHNSITANFFSDCYQDFFKKFK